jgi:predicted nucleic acid-binding protein
VDVALLLDTNRLTDVLRQDPACLDTVERAVEVYVPFVALAEIKAGFAGGNPQRRAHNAALLRSFLRLPAVQVLCADQETTDVYAAIFAQLRQAGTAIPTHDIWIASLAVQHRLLLYTRDGHFAKVPQVARW